MGIFWKQAALMFVALRAGDAVNLAAGLWLVPKFIAPCDLGAVLPLTTYATFFSIPLFAFGMAVMKESADLAGKRMFGCMKSLLAGIFLAIAAFSLVAITAMYALLPRFLGAMRVSDRTAAFLAIAAALLGTAAPVYTDALQAIRRFKSLAAIELAAATARFATLAIAMPVRALAGYFAGSVVQPVVRIAASVWCLRRELSVPPERYWHAENFRNLFRRFALVTIYLALPMLCSLVEQSLIREQLCAADSAGYYMVTRLTDILNYLTYPLLIVIFPYAAEARRNGSLTTALVLRSCAATVIAASLLCVLYLTKGETLLPLLPHGAEYTAYLGLVPLLLATNVANACQTFYTNAEVAAGRHSFLLWFAPVNLLYATLLPLLAPHYGEHSLKFLVSLFLLAALIRMIGCIVEMGRRVSLGNS